MACSKSIKIMWYLWFDLKSLRSERLQTDQFAMVSEISNKFIENPSICYIGGYNLIIFKQLFVTKACFVLNAALNFG